jgi:hypothetical protein
MARSRKRNWFSLSRISRRKNASRKTPYGCRLDIEPLEERRMLSLTVPAFHSHPSATAKLYLDFDGSPAFDWGGTRAHGPGSNDAPIPAFTMDGDANNFSPAEITTITNMFNIVAEKFSPFNLDVTTVDPGNRTHGVTLTDIIGGSNSDWYGSGGGVSLVGSFTNTNLSNTVFAWTGDGSAWSTPDQITFLTDFTAGNTIPHEAGHAFGLVHERTPGAPGQPLNEYYNGDGTRSPIMGASANGDNAAKRGIWWLTNMEGGQQSPDPIQDELSIISGANNGFGYRSDDWSYGSGNYFTMPVAADGSLGPVNGLIENTGDVDPFRFTAIGTTGTFKITATLSATGGGMLEPSGRLVDASTLQPISFSIVANGTTATLSSTSLVPGHDYYIEARSFGNYGDIGQYFVSGNLQGFASYNSATRTVTVHGLGGNNNITMFTSGNTLTVQDSLNGGSTATQNFTLSAVDSVSVSLGGGDDKLNCIGLTKADSSALPVYISMGGGFDTLNLGGGGTFLTFTVNEIEIDVSYANGVRFAQFWNFDAERVEIHGTTSDSDLFNINSLNSYSNIYAYGDQGADKMVISPAVMGAYTNAVIFYGGDGTDTLELDGSTLGFNQSFVMLGTAIQRFVPSSPFGSEAQFDSTTEIFNIKGGSGNDTFELLGVASGKTVNATGNGGDDTFRLGKSDNGPFPYPFSGNIFGNINVVGGAGNNDLLYVDDVAWNGGLSGSFTITSSYIAGGVLTQATVTFDAGLEHLEYHASNTRPGSMTLLGIPTTPALSLFGGTSAFDVLIVDDRNLQVVPFQMDLGSDYYKEYYGTPQSPTIRQLTTFPGFEQVKLYGHANTTAINVMAVPTGRSLNVTAGSQTSTTTLYPHDAAGNLTVNADVTVSGKLIIDDTGQANPIDYVFISEFGIIDEIKGLGTGIVGPGSPIVIKAGDGDDTFDFNQHKSNTAVSIYGGGGNDTLEVAAVSKNISANIATLTNLTFDGGNGYDVMRLHNDNANASYGGYNVSGSQLQITEGLQGTYQATFIQNSVEYTGITAGTQSDFLSVPNSAAGTYYDFDGGSGAVVDELYLGAQLNPFTSGIHGGVRFNGGGGGNDTITLYDQSDATGRTLHVGNGQIGGTAGDNIFGAGGYVQYVGVTGRMTVGLGTGADTVYAIPEASTPITINGGSPTVAPGDRLNLALSAAQNYVVSGTPASGNVTSSNRQTLNWTGFETGPIIDAIAPSIVAQSYDESGLVPTIFVQFSENVSNSLTANFLDLINTTTAQQVSPSEIALTYDAGTNTARFTFPGFPNGVLPVGDYTATIDGSLPDSFGNLLGVETPFSFIVATPPPQLPGDYNLNGEVDTSDYIVWRKTLGNAVTTFSGADGNGDGTIGPEDYDVWRANFGNTLPAAAAGNDASVAKEQTRTASVQGSVISSDPTTGIATPEVSLIDSTSVARQSRTVFGSDSKTVNVESVFASAYAGARKWSTFPAFHSDLARLAADHQGVPLTQAPNNVTDVHVAFEDQGQRYDNYQADEPSADLVWEAVDKVFESRWGSADLIAI